jgi:acetolactate synthase I/III small subunit
MEHIFVILVEDKPGVLNRVASLFRRRAFNIESLAVGHTDVPGLSRMTIVIDGEKASAERVMAYLYKLVNVIQVEDLSEHAMVRRDLVMIKVKATSENRAEIMQIADVFRAHIVDVTSNSMIVEITGDEEKLSGFVEVMRPMGIIEMVRTGAVAMARGSSSLLESSSNYAAQYAAA